jgi:hypothetical protein
MVKVFTCCIKVILSVATIRFWVKICIYYTYTCIYFTYSCIYLTYTVCTVFAFFPICINLISTVLIGLTTKIDRAHWRIAHYANWKKESKNVTCCRCKYFTYTWKLYGMEQSSLINILFTIFELSSLID